MAFPKTGPLLFDPHGTVVGPLEEYRRELDRMIWEAAQKRERELEAWHAERRAQEVKRGKAR